MLKITGKKLFETEVWGDRLAFRLRFSRYGFVLEKPKGYTPKSLCSVKLKFYLKRESLMMADVDNLVKGALDLLSDRGFFKYDDRTVRHIDAIKHGSVDGSTESFKVEIYEWP